MKTRTTIIPASVIAAALAMGYATDVAQANNLFGIDVSNNNGSVNWSSVYANGARYAWAKATEGNYFQDGYYNGNMTSGKSAGMKMGAYDFVRPDTDCVSTDVNYFWSFAGGKIVNDGKTISPACDYEVSGSSCQPNDTAWANTWGSDVKAKTTLTMKPVLYCSASFACNFIEYDKSGGIQLSPWIANYNGGNLYTGNPWETYSCCNAWTTGCGSGGWQFWQVSSTGSIGGVSGGCDFDAYVGGSVTTLQNTFGVK
jgi:lysozyme